MQANSVQQRKLSSKIIVRAADALLVAVMMLALVGWSPVAAQAAKVQPQLLALAAQQPGATVSVIVQKTASDQAVEQHVATLGGKVTADLHIINAFAATIPAAQVNTLAANPAVRWVSLDAPVEQTDKGGSKTGAIDVSKLANAYVKTIGADKVWNASPYYQGQGIGVAVVDSGVNQQQDLYNGGTNRIVANVRFNNGYNQSTSDGYGHGSHVAGIVGGNGGQSAGKYIGVAPLVNIVNVKVSDDAGAATASNVVSGFQWILDNRSKYNIRVVNVSLNSSVAASYNNDPLDAAAEILWFNKIVVVVSAGNNGANKLYAPANDPFVITVGATDDRGTASLSDDTIPSFSAYGNTTDNFAKPDLVAPGTNVISLMANQNSPLATAHPDHKVSGTTAYFRMSGTSMAAPVVAGAAALLIQSNPNLTPDQVKYRLKATANKSWAGYNATKAGAGMLDVYAAIQNSSTSSANTGTKASQLLWTGSQPVTWGSVNWNSVNWNTVNWNTVNWNTVNWNTVNWNSDYWGP